MSSYPEYNFTSFQFDQPKPPQPFSIRHLSDPAAFYHGNAQALNDVYASAFERQVQDVAPHVADRFDRAQSGQVMLQQNKIVGFALYRKIAGRQIGVGYNATSVPNALHLQAIAVSKEHQHKGLGTRALKEKLDADSTISAVAAVTRNPAVVKMLRNVFHIVVPDLGARTQPLHALQNDEVRLISDVMSKYAGVQGSMTPFTFGYKSGVYGGRDPGRDMPMPEISRHPENGILAIGYERKGR